MTQENVCKTFLAHRWPLISLKPDRIAVPPNSRSNGQTIIIIKCIIPAAPTSTCSLEKNIDQIKNKEKAIVTPPNIIANQPAAGKVHEDEIILCHL